MKFYVHGQEVTREEFAKTLLSQPFPPPLPRPPLPHELKLVPPVQFSYDRDTSRFRLQVNLFPLADARLDRDCS